MCATHGGSWRRWRSSAGSTGLTKPSCGGSFWPVRTRRREASPTDQETWWDTFSSINLHWPLQAQVSTRKCIVCFLLHAVKTWRSQSRSDLGSAGGSFPHPVWNRRLVSPRGRADQTGESGSVHARGCPAEDRPAARPPKLVWRCSSQTQTLPPLHRAVDASQPGRWKQKEDHNTPLGLTPFWRMNSDFLS